MTYKFGKIFAVGLALAASLASTAQLKLSYAEANLQNTGQGIGLDGVSVTFDPAGNAYTLATAKYSLNNIVRNCIWFGQTMTNGIEGFTIQGRNGLKGENDYAKAVVRDGLGNFYIAAEGNYQVVNGHPNSSMMLLKYNSVGTLLWGKFFAGIPGQRNVPVGVGVDSLNRPYIGGTSGNGSQAEFAVAQYSPAGVQNWSHVLKADGGLATTSTAAGIKVMPNGDVYVGGTVQPPTGATAPWYVKFDNAGTMQLDSGFTLDPSVIYQVNAMDVAPDGSVGLVGASSPSDTEMFLAAFNPNGTLNFTRQYSGNFSSGMFDTKVGAQAVSATADGSFLVTGGLEASGGTYVQNAMVKWDKTGTFFSNPVIFGTASNLTRVTASAVDQYNRVYVSYTNSQAAFSYTQAGVAAIDSNLMKLAGYVVIGDGANKDRFASVAVDTKGQVYVGGSAQNVPSPTNCMTAKYYQPVTVKDKYITMHKNVTLTYNAANGVLLGAKYIIGTPAVNLLLNPTHASNFMLNADGSFTYTPTSGYTGIDFFKFNVTQGTQTGNTGQVTFNIIP